MRLEIAWTNQFKKDYKLAMKRGLKIDLFRFGKLLFKIFLLGHDDEIRCRYDGWWD